MVIVVSAGDDDTSRTSDTVAPTTTPVSRTVPALRRRSTRRRRYAESLHARYGEAGARARRVAYPLTFEPAQEQGIAGDIDGAPAVTLPPVHSRVPDFFAPDCMALQR